jgi:N-methylhydantoinase B/oxoprolinase/acetone carboxylase alpha subunit
MKTLTSIYANGEYQDAIIEHYSLEFKTPELKVVWADEKNCIAKCHQDAKTITIYVKDYEDNKKITVVILRADSIKKLYSLMTEIEKQTSEEFID